MNEGETIFSFRTQDPLPGLERIVLSDEEFAKEEKFANEVGWRIALLMEISDNLNDPRGLTEENANELRTTIDDLKREIEKLFNPTEVTTWQEF